MSYKILEEDDYLFLLFGLAFLHVNFDAPIINVYEWLAIIGLFGYFLARKTFSVIPYSKRGTSWLEALLVAGVAYVIFSFVLIPLISQLTITEFVKTTFAQTPALSGNKLISLIVWGVIIPYIETTTLFRTLPQWISYKYNLAMTSLMSKSSIIIMVVTSAIFTLFHITAKGVTNTPALITTFVFGLISVGLIIYYQEVKQSGVFHIIVNLLGMMSIYGIL